LDDIFLTADHHKLIEHKNKTIGTIAHFPLANNASLYKIYSLDNKYLGSLASHDTYISQEYTSQLSRKEKKQFLTIVKKISRHQNDQIKKKIRPKADHLSLISNNLYDGETLSNYMDYWIKK
jgi:hypothetical protein